MLFETDGNNSNNNNNVFERYSSLEDVFYSLNNPFLFHKNNQEGDKICGRNGNDPYVEVTEKHEKLNVVKYNNPEDHSKNHLIHSEVDFQCIDYDGCIQSIEFFIEVDSEEIFRNRQLGRNRLHKLVPNVLKGDLYFDSNNICLIWYTIESQYQMVIGFDNIEDINIFEETEDGNAGGTINAYYLTTLQSIRPISISRSSIVKCPWQIICNDVNDANCPIKTSSSFLLLKMNKSNQFKSFNLNLGNGFIDFISFLSIFMIGRNSSLSKMGVSFYVSNDDIISKRLKWFNCDLYLTHLSMFIVYQSNYIIFLWRKNFNNHIENISIINSPSNDDDNFNLQFTYFKTPKTFKFCFVVNNEYLANLTEYLTNIGNE